MWDVVRAAGRRRLDRAADHPVPRGGRRAGRRDHASSTTAGSSPTTPRTGSSGSSAARRIGVRPTDPTGWTRPPRSSPSVVRARGRGRSATGVLTVAGERRGRAGRHGRAGWPSAGIARHRALAAPADPGRGLHDPHRPHGAPTARHRRTTEGGGSDDHRLTDAPRRRDRSPPHRPPRSPPQAVPRWLRHIARAGQAQPDQDVAHAGGADRRHPAADHLPGAVHLHLRRRDRRRPRTTTCSSCCPACSARPSRWPASRSAQNLNADIEKGVFDRFRSLPIGRSVPLVGAVIADVVPVPDPVRRDARLRHAHGLPDRDQRRCARPPACGSRSPSRCASAGSRCSSG